MHWIYTIMAITYFTIETLASPAFAQQDFAKVKIKITHVADNVYMLEGMGGNIGVSIGPDGVLMVDDPFAPLADKIRTAVSEDAQR